MKTILIVLGGLLGAAVFSYLVFGNPDASTPIPRPGENAAPAAALILILLIWLGTGAVYGRTVETSVMDRAEKRSDLDGAGQDFNHLGYHHQRDYAVSTFPPLAAERPWPRSSTG